MNGLREQLDDGYEGRRDTWRAMAEKRTGGPKTLAGKARSSQNACKHGVLAKSLRDGEERAEYEEIERGWRTQFAPADYQEERLVQILIQNDWMLRRASRRYLELEQEQWTLKRQHELELMQRYRTTAERSFYRAWGALRGLRRDLEKFAKETFQLQTKAELMELNEEAARRASEAEAGGERACEGPGAFSGGAAEAKARDNGIYWRGIRAITQYLLGEAGKARGGGFGAGTARRDCAPSMSGERGADWCRPGADAG